MGLVKQDQTADRLTPPLADLGGLAIIDEGGTLRIANSNTTVGYLRYSADPPGIDYIFVHPAFRRQGYAARLVRALEAKCGCYCPPAPPHSPLGEAFFHSIERAA